MPRSTITRQDAPPPGSWWSTPWFAVLISLTLAVPLLRPAVAPLIDIYGHLARFAIDARIDSSPYFHQWFAVQWRLSGNLGMDLLVAAAEPLLDVVETTKIALIAAAVLTAAGMLAVAKEAHGRIPPSAFFALPLTFGMPFQYGFLNYTLSIAFAFPLTALWMRLGRGRRYRLRTAVFLPLGLLLWVTHVAGWGAFCVAVFAIELVTARRDGRGWPRAIWSAGLACLPLAVPTVIMLAQSGTPSAGIAQWFSWLLKLFFVAAILRDQHLGFDIASVMLLYGLVLCGLRGAGFRMEARLACASGLLFCVFLLMPGMVMGSSFTDMRLLPCALALAILSLSPTTTNHRHLTMIAIAALAFLGTRLAVQTVSWARLEDRLQDQLAAIDHIPRGSRVVALADLPCEAQWTSRRMDHLGMMAIVRRDAFVNGLWDIPSSQLRIHRPEAGGFVYAGSQALFAPGCRYDEGYDLQRALATIPYAAFDFVWLIDTPRVKWPTDARLRLVWSTDRGALYRIVHRASE